MHQLLCILWTVLSLALVQVARAQPVSLSESEFATRTAELPKVAENFNGFAFGQQPSPLTIANGVYLGNPSIGQPPWCFSSPCLSTGIASGTFEEFPAGTAYWSARIHPVSGSQAILITVTGRSGTREFESSPTPWTIPGRFVGFHDPRGLLRVSFRQVPETTNYSLDDVVTAVAAEPPQPVPVLSPFSVLHLSMLTLSLGWLSMRRC